MFSVSSCTSTKTGVAPVWTITFAVAGQVIGVVITSSPGPMPRATSARCSAAVPDASASTCSASRYSAARRSSSAAAGPVVSQPERSVAATAAISSSPIAGGWKPIVRRVGVTSAIAAEGYSCAPSGPQDVAGGRLQPPGGGGSGGAGKTQKRRVGSS